MLRGESFPEDQAYIFFNDAFVEFLEDLTEQQKIDVLAEVVVLCKNPVGSHTLSNRQGQKLAGWNTVDVLEKQYRVIFASKIDHVDGTPVGSVEVLVAGPRKAEAAYDMAAALVKSGRIKPDEMTEIWEALALLDIAAETVGLDGWDYRPLPAPDGLVKAAAAAGLLDVETASWLSIDEINTAMAEGWQADGTQDPVAALSAALSRARTRVEGMDLSQIMKRRKEQRCDAVLKRTGQLCIRREGHPGAHRSTT